MTSMHPAEHATFTLERLYDVPPSEVFAAWADPATKARWFASPGAEHSLDFRVGGIETTRGGPDPDVPFVFTSTYEEIQPGARLVYSSTLAGRVATVSLTCVEIAERGSGSALVLTEHGIFLDHLEESAWREQGTAEWLDRLQTVLG